MDVSLNITDRVLDHTFTKIVSKHEDVPGVDESDVNFVATLQKEADNNGMFNLHLRRFHSSNDSQEWLQKP